MINDLQFRIGSGLKNIIGRELITDDFIAIFELVKNSFDAHATLVEITFENILEKNGKIIIADNGKGMNYEDLIKKWLFVAYSAKKDGTEDFDYRSKLQSKFFFTGAKGIGRFSCDKLGSQLRLISTKNESNAKTEEIKVDWTKFEQDSKEEFININVKHQTLHENPSKFKTGTILEISGIRNDSIWDAEKLLKLKSSLAKLINPFDDKQEREFKINIKAEEFVEFDLNQTEPNRTVNGVVKNYILDILRIKTVKIISKISGDGKNISTELSNNGIWLYRILEKNTQYNLLHDILSELYFLDRKAKNNFTRLMGMKAGEYGSVFLYKNGVRIYPFGEPGEDSFSLDRRQQKRLGDYVGTSELIGRIEISGDNIDFKETTSRGDGLIKNTSYEQLQSFFIEKVIEKLESFRRNIFKYGIDIDEFEKKQHNHEQIVKLIADISNDDNIISIEINPNLLQIINETQEENTSAKTLIKSIEEIARKSDNQLLFDKIKKVKNKLNDAIALAELAEDDLKEKERELKEGVSQNLFLKSLKSHEFIELVSLMHHIGISSGIISNHLKILTYKIDKGIEVNSSELREAIGVLNLENQKILSISRFATKANFKMNAESQRLDLIEFITQYIQNIVKTFNNEIEINIQFSRSDKFQTVFKPIEMTIVIDNLINNAKKASAWKLDIEIETKEDTLFVIFSDNGIGISPRARKKVFDFGFTTTGGSGLGLTHVREILQSINGKIAIMDKHEDGTAFLLTFKKQQK